MTKITNQLFINLISKVLAGFVFFMIAFGTASSQSSNNKFTIQVEAVSSSGPVVQATVTHQWAKDRFVSRFGATGKDGRFIDSVSFNGLDTLITRVSHTGYETVILKTYFTKKVDTFLLVQMTENVAELAHVEITGPAMWQRGDTSFYKVDSFKNNLDKKLVDVLNRFPYLEIRQGMLFFKGKAVNKITIDGEELMENQIQLLINAIPVHILENVQVLENQRSRRNLLNSFGNETFINLQTRKDINWTRPVGDIEAGAAVPLQGKLSTTLLSLREKSKMLGIFSHSNFDNAISYQQQRQTQLAGMNPVGVMGMYALQATALQFLPNEGFLTGSSSKQTARLQWNKKREQGSAKTMIGFYMNKDKQDYYTYNRTFLNNGVLERNFKRQITSSPVFADIKHETGLFTKNKNQIFFTTNVFTDFSRVNSSEFIEQPGSNSQIIEKTQFNDLIVRQLIDGTVGNEKAKRGFSLEAGYFFRKGSDLSISDRWQKVFNTPVAKNELQMDMDFQRIQLIGSLGKKVPSKNLFAPKFKVHYKYDQLKFQHSIFDIIKPGRYQPGKNGYHFLLPTFEHDLPTVRKEGMTFSNTVAWGPQLFILQQQTEADRYSKWLPHVRVVSELRLIRKNVMFNLSNSFGINYLSESQAIFNNLLSLQNTGYYYYSNHIAPRTTYMGVIGGAISFFERRLTMRTHYMLNNNWNETISKRVQQDLLVTSEYFLLNKSSLGQSIVSAFDITTRKRKKLASAKYNFMSNQFWSMQNDIPKMQTMASHSAGLDFSLFQKKGWNLVLANEFRSSRTRLATSGNYLYNLFSSSIQGGYTWEGFMLEGSANYFSSKGTQGNSESQGRGTFLNFTMAYQIKNSPFKLELKGVNLLNSREIVTQMVDAGNVFLNMVPLRPRFVFGALHYSF